MNFREWIKIEEKTLYHGTLVDNEQSIRKYGLQGGWQGPLGSFVAQHYGDEDYGKPTEEDEVVFLTDKQALGKAVNAMVHHIGVKLKKDFHDVTDNDIKSYGLLVMVKDSDIEPYDPEDRRWADGNPRGAETGDYFTSSTKGDVFLKGAALIRFLKRNDEWPRNWGVGTEISRNKYFRGKLGAWAIARGHEKGPALEKIKNAPIDAVQDQLRHWK